MKSRIYEEAVANVQHSFGESMEPRIPAIYITEGGSERVLLFTRAQILAAQERAERETVEAMSVCEAASRHDGMSMLLDGAIIALSFTVGVVVGALL